MGAGTEDGRVRVLTGMVISLIREVTVLHEILKEKDIVTRDEFKKGMLEAMIGDSSSQGFDSHRNYTWYPYLDCAEGRARRLGLNEEELRIFLEEVDRVSTLT
jgi:hypothetical protein